MVEPNFFRGVVQNVNFRPQGGDSVILQGPHPVMGGDLTIQNLALNVRGFVIKSKTEKFSILIFSLEHIKITLSEI